MPNPYARLRLADQNARQTCFAPINVLKMKNSVVGHGYLTPLIKIGAP
jgi:hypothetical protein